MVKISTFTVAKGKRGKKLNKENIGIFKKGKKCQVLTLKNAKS